MLRGWVGGLDQGLKGWCYVCVSMDSLCRLQVQVSVYCDWRIPAHVFSPVAPYGYPLHTVHLFMADIAIPDLFLCDCRTWICLDITRDFMRNSASQPVGPHGRLPPPPPPQTVNRGPIAEAGGFDTICTSVGDRFDTPPLVDFAVWSRK